MTTVEYVECMNPKRCGVVRHKSGTRAAQRCAGSKGPTPDAGRDFPDSPPPSMEEPPEDESADRQSLRDALIDRLNDHDSEFPWDEYDTPVIEDPDGNPYYDLLVAEAMSRRKDAPDAVLESVAAGGYATIDRMDPRSPMVEGEVLRVVLRAEATLEDRKSPGLGWGYLDGIRGAHAQAYLEAGDEQDAEFHEKRMELVEELIAERDHRINRMGLRAQLHALQEQRRDAQPHDREARPQQQRRAPARRYRPAGPLGHSISHVPYGPNPFRGTVYDRIMTSILRVFGIR